MKTIFEIYAPGSDIFRSGCNALVNPVNCVGVSGKGLALEFKKRHSDNFIAYKKHCDNGMKPGNSFAYEIHSMCSYQYILNVATKGHWRDRSTFNIIAQCCKSIRLDILQLNIQSIAIPALGCGCGRVRLARS